MSKSTHQIAVKATDQTAGAFASIQTRAAAASAKLRSMLGGAMAAAGAYFGFRSIAGAINELGTLSDIATATSTNVEELTKTATALNVLGIRGMGVEGLAKAFQMMEKNTGRIGMEGFRKTIGELGRIPDLAERGKAAMGVFGRSGMAFMPLINAADKSTNALRSVIDAMPGVSRAAADAGGGLKRMVAAMNGLGVRGMDVEGLAKAFQMMEKNTGRSGMEGFYQTINEIGKIPDVAERGKAAVDAFGGSGTAFMPLINAADTSTEALQRVIEAMPGISQAAADAGDKMNDAKAIGVSGFKKLWLDAIGSVSKDLDKNFTGGAREAALKGVAYIEYFVKTSWSHVKEFCSKAALLFSGLGENLSEVFTNLFDYYKTFFGAVGGWIADVVTVSWDEIKENGVFGKANERFSKAMSEASDKLLRGVDFDAIATLMLDGDKYRGALLKQLNDAKNKAEVVEQAIEAAVESSGARDNRTGDKVGDLLGGKMRSRIVNELIMGGSARSLNLAMMGPQMNNELKKQTNILERIRVNTQKTEENTRDSDGENYEVLT